MTEASGAWAEVSADSALPMPDGSVADFNRIRHEYFDIPTSLKSSGDTLVTSDKVFFTSASRRVVDIMGSSGWLYTYRLPNMPDNVLESASRRRRT